MNKQFTIELCSDVDFEGMTVEILFDNQTIATLNYDKGIDNIEMEISENVEKLAFPLQGFLTAVEKAKKLIIKCAEEDKLRKDE